MSFCKLEKRKLNISLILYFLLPTIRYVLELLNNTMLYGKAENQFKKYIYIYVLCCIWYTNNKPINVLCILLNIQYLRIRWYMSNVVGGLIINHSLTWF